MFKLLLVISALAFAYAYANVVVGHAAVPVVPVENPVKSLHHHSHVAFFRLPIPHHGGHAVHSHAATILDAAQNKAKIFEPDSDESDIEYVHHGQDSSVGYKKPDSDESDIQYAHRGQHRCGVHKKHEGY